MSVVISIIIMLLILSVLALIHEFGHFIAARIFKVKVAEFSIFMGPLLFQRESKKTGTKFSIRLCPLGGYCAFADDEGDFQSPDSLNAQKWWKRAIIFSAGVFLNVVLAFIISIFLVGSNGMELTTLESVNRESMAAVIGLEAGDKLTEMNNIDVLTYLDNSLASQFIEDSNDSDQVMESHYTMVYKKADGSKVKYDVRKKIQYNEDVTAYEYIEYTINEYYRKVEFISYDEETQLVKCNEIIKKNDEIISEGEKNITATIFLSMGNSNYTYRKTWNPFFTIPEGFKFMISQVKSVYLTLGWLIQGKIGVEAISGPIGITSVVNDVVSTTEINWAEKIWSLFYMASLISANLAVMNFLPFPGLDGFHIVFIIIELLRKGKKVPPKAQNTISYIGLAIMILLAVVVMVMDIGKLI